MTEETDEENEPEFRKIRQVNISCSSTRAVNLISTFDEDSMSSLVSKALLILRKTRE